MVYTARGPGGLVLEGNKIMASQLLKHGSRPNAPGIFQSREDNPTPPDGLKDIPLPLTKILQAKTPDVALEASDIIYVPESRLKGVMEASNIVGLLAGAAIYRL